MPRYEVTPQMSTMIKTLRIRNNIKASDIAKKIGKSGAFISKLEKNILSSIDSKDFFAVMKILTQNENEHDFESIMSNILQDAKLNFSKKELEKEEWLLNLDFFYRSITIPNQYPAYLKTFLDEHSISLDRLVSYINSNKDLYANPDFSKELLDTSEKNHWYFNEGNSYILVNVEKKDVENILNMQKHYTNYSILQCLLLSAFRLSGYSVKDAYEEAHSKLQEFNIYSLDEKTSIMNQYEDLGKMHTVLDQRDNESLPLIDRQLLHNLYKFINLYNSFAELHGMEYATEKLNCLVNNYENDPILMMGLFGIDLSSLKKADITIKRKFVKEITTLAEEYKNKTNEPSTELI